MNFLAGNRRLGPRGTAAIAAAVAAVILFLLGEAGGLTYLERWSLDHLAALPTFHRVGHPPCLVAIDDRTLSATGSWPVPRRFYFRLFSAIAAGQAAGVGVDLLFADPDLRDPAADTLLANFARDHREFIFGIPLAVTGPPGKNAVAAGSRPRLPQDGPPGDAVRLWTVQPAGLPVPPLLLTARFAHVSVALDADGISRRLPPFVDLDGRLMPALSLALAGQAANRGEVTSVRRKGNRLFLHWTRGRDTSLLLDRRETVQPRFRKYTLPTLSAAAVVDAFDSGQIHTLKGWFAGKAVLVGNTAVRASVADIGPLWNTPLGPLVRYHCDAVEALGAERVADAPGRGLSLLLLLLLAMGMALIYERYPPARLAPLLLLFTTVNIGATCLASMLTPCAVPAAFLVLPPAVAGTSLVHRLVRERRQRRDRHNERLRAVETMDRLQPATTPTWTGYALAWDLLQAQQVGGDIAIIHESPAGRCFIGIADVSGFGLPAALLASHIVGALRLLLQGNASLSEIAGTLHSSIWSGRLPGTLVTLFLAEIDLVTHRIHYVNCGHEPGILLHQGEARFLSPSSDALGLFPTPTIATHEAQLSPGDALLLVTDGITGLSSRGKEYGLTRLVQVAATALVGTSSPRGVLAAINDDLAAFGGGQVAEDDLCTVLAIRTPAP